MTLGKAELYPEIVSPTSNRLAYHGCGFSVQNLSLTPSENGARQGDDYCVIVHRGLPATLEWVTSGRTVKRTFRGGDVTFHAPGELPPFHLCDPAVVLQIALSPLLPEQILRDAATGIGALPNRYGMRDPQTEHIAHTFVAELAAGSPGGALLADSLVTALTAHLFAPSPAPVKPSQGGLSRRDMARVRDFVQAHLCDELTVGTLAALTDYSPHHFSLLFKQTIGMSPHRFVIRERVERATRLLRDGNATLSQIAYSVGFANQSHFQQHFKRVWKMTPGEYRDASRR